MLSTLISGALASAVVILFAHWGGAEALGAHPWWAMKTAIGGAPAGALVAVFLWAVWRAKRPRVILFLALLAAAYAAAYFGKEQFAASYGDDAQAGRFWYFGWIATCGAASGLLTSILGRSERLS
ncbi:MAG: hypothetical protein GY952_07495 [Rhodobacteraceae bacterium]|nr:hypothetical protein [Paracoccaceae bacterium]